MSRHYPVRKDTLDHRDHIFNRRHNGPDPIAVDLRDQFSPIVDQGQLGSCTANAIVSGLREFYLKKAGQFTPLSRLFLYYQERKLEGTIDQDSGAFIRDGMKVITSTGVCPEGDFPYDIRTFTNEPNVKAYQDAPTFKLSHYKRVAHLADLKHSLSLRIPVVFGFTVYESFESDSVAHTGNVPIPRKGEQCLGGHAVIAAGYDDQRQAVIVRNSWGDTWGDHGYCYMPYSFWDLGLITDMWTAE